MSGQNFERLPIRYAKPGQVLRPPHLEGKFNPGRLDIWLWVVGFTTTITRPHVESVAHRLYADAKTGEFHPLADHLRTVVPLNSWQNKLLNRDPVLPYVALRYGVEEMEEVLDRRPALEREVDNYSELDTIAGEGPPRPVIFELYGLNTRGLISFDAPQAKDETESVYEITPKGRGEQRRRVRDFRNFRGKLTVIGPEGIESQVRVPQWWHRLWHLTPSRPAHQANS